MPSHCDEQPASGTRPRYALTDRPELLGPPARAYPLAMGKVFDEIDERLRDWIYAQALFFVATAPLAADGHVNVSPKGPIGTLRVLDGHTLAYLDVIGSGAETIAHIRENRRVVVMLCAFSGPPRILRIHGRGDVVPAGDERFAELIERCDFEEPLLAAARRSVVLVEVTRVADSCGYGVPLMRFEGLRPHADAWAEKKLRVGGEHALLAYQREKNAASLDGLPAVEL
jgi:Pyridoxamine 5'-phosphate oxidase